MNIQNKKNIVYLIFVSLIFLLSFCKSKKKALKNEASIVMNDTLPSEKCKFSGIKTSELIRRMNQSELTYRTLNIKAICSFTIEENSEDVDLKIRMIKDSLLWAHIDYLSIDIARILITNDSVKFINYRQKQYMAESIDLLSKILNTEVDLNMLQSILIGNSAEFYSDDDKIRSFLDKEYCLYHLSTLKKRKLKKVEEGKRELTKVLQNISLHPENFKILANAFHEPEQNRSFIAEYHDFSSIDSIFAPRRVNINLQVGKKIDIKLKYVRMEKDKSAQVSFRIPPKYERILISKD